GRQRLGDRLDPPRSPSAGNLIGLFRRRRYRGGSAPFLRDLNRRVALTHVHDEPREQCRDEKQGCGNRTRDRTPCGPPGDPDALDDRVARATLGTQHAVQRFDPAQAIPSPTDRRQRDQIDRTFVAAIDGTPQVLELDDRILDIARDPHELGAELVAASLTFAAISLLERYVCRGRHDDKAPGRRDSHRFHSSAPPLDPTESIPCSARAALLIVHRTFPYERPWQNAPARRAPASARNSVMSSGLHA